ncbi:MAG: ScpA family protein [Alphaproteobacteria bacterium]
MSEAEAPQFEEDLLKDRSESEQLLLYLGSFDGPIDMLLTLARDQKVDLAKISILALANQYLEFVQKAQSLRLELAADYLVMAAWLAYLKSRLLIPVEEQKQAEPTAQEVADALQFQLRRLEAMRDIAQRLFHLPRLGYNIFARGEPDGLPTSYISKYEMTYYDLLKAYGDVKLRQQNSVYKLAPVKLFTLEEAIERLTTMFGKLPQEWVSLFMFLPPNLKERIVKRSAVASTFGGALEMAKRGLIQIQQEKNYAPIYIRKPVANENTTVPAAADAVSPTAAMDAAGEETEASVEEVSVEEVAVEETVAEEVIAEEEIIEETAPETVAEEEQIIEETVTEEVTDTNTQENT